MTKPSILVVETDILVRHPLAEFLRECGYHVLEAANADEARAVLEDASLSVEVALVDVGDGNGPNFALVRWARTHCPGTRLLLAGTIGAAANEAGGLCADQPEIRKPYDHKAVHNHIRRLLAAREQQRRDETEGD